MERSGTYNRLEKICRLSGSITLLVIMLLIPTQLINTVISSFYDQDVQMTLTVDHESDSEEKEKSEEKEFDDFIHIIYDVRSETDRIPNYSMHGFARLKSRYFDILTPPPRI